MWADYVLSSEEFARFLAGAFVMGGIAGIVGVIVGSFKEQPGAFILGLGILSWAVGLLALLGLPAIRVLHWVFTGE